MEMTPMLVGSYEHSIDGKGRVSLPATFRKTLPAQLIVSMSPECALYVFTRESYEAWVSSLFPQGFDPRDPQQVKVRRAVTKNAFTVDVDASGRISLLASLRTRAKLDKEVTIVGAYDHFEIWDREIWNKLDAEVDDFESYYHQGDQA